MTVGGIAALLTAREGIKYAIAPLLSHFSTLELLLEQNCQPLKQPLNTVGCELWQCNPLQ